MSPHKSHRKLAEIGVERNRALGRPVTMNSLFKKIGMVVADLHFDVGAVFSSSSSSIASMSLPFLAVLLVKVETLPPLLMRRRLAPTIPAKEIFPGCGTTWLIVIPNVRK